MQDVNIMSTWFYRGISWKMWEIKALIIFLSDRQWRHQQSGIPGLCVQHHRSQALLHRMSPRLTTSQEIIFIANFLFNGRVRVGQCGLGWIWRIKFRIFPSIVDFRRLRVLLRRRHYVMTSQHSQIHRGECPHHCPPCFSPCDVTVWRHEVTWAEVIAIWHVHNGWQRDWM